MVIGFIIYLTFVFFLFQDETSRLDEEESFLELAVAPEQPSPVSVLDTFAYKDDAPSPVKQIPIVLEGKFSYSVSLKSFSVHCSLNLVED